jgi:hypothetical protein
MDGQRVQAYLALIQELLTCPSGEEPQILNRHRDLVDEGFVLVYELMAAQFQTTGGQSQQQVLENFWLQLVKTEIASGGNETAVHQVMRQNMALLTPALGNTIVRWVQRVLVQHPNQAEFLASLVEDTCVSIRQFPYGRYFEALEIAILGYGEVLKLRTDNPQKRARTLANLGVARKT